MQDCQAMREITRAYSVGLEAEDAPCHPLPECAVQAVAYYLGAWQYENDDEIEAYDVDANIVGFELVDSRDDKRNCDLFDLQPEFYRLYVHPATGDAVIVYAEYFVRRWCQCSFVLRRK
jgi:hypothetical protein